VAERFGVTEMTVGNWERGREQPTIRHTAAIVGFLGFDPEPALDSLPGRLRAIRRRLGLTQADLAARLGQDEHQICRWERGRQKPHPWIAGRINLGLSALEGRSVDGPEPQPSYFDLTRWRRRRTIGVDQAKPTTTGERLREARLQLGLSQEAAGRILGVSGKVLYDWERNVTPVPPSRMAVARRLLWRLSHRRRKD
jgi:transcriptional regulator with XRE-family HTH domain